MLGTVKVAGADAATTNRSGNNWAPTLLVAAQRAFLFKLVVSCAAAADVYVWIFNSATGTTTNPVAFLMCPAGATTTLDFTAGGSLFTSGIYFLLCTAAPTDATTDGDASICNNNAALVKADYRLVP